MLAILVLLSFISVIKSRFIELTPLKCRGTFSASRDNVVPAAFLSRGKLEVLESEESGDQNRAILCDVIPIPLLDKRGESLVNQLQDNQQKSAQFGFDTNSITGILINRDKGIYDNLPYCWKKGTNAKLELFNNLQRSGGTSPKGTFLAAINDVLDSRITGLTIEVRDEINSEKIILGAAAVFCQNDVADDWKISRSNPKLPTISSNDDPIDIAEATACIVECHLDELIAISLLTGLPILIPQLLFDSLTIDASLTNNPNGKNKRSDMSITGPIFRSAEKRREWNDRYETKNEDSSSVKEASPAWEIFDANKFLKMTPVEKRAVLRASGVNSLPRPREGLDNLDRALLEKMDDAVRGEFLRLKNSNPMESAGLSSPRQILLRSMGEALDNGDIEKAKIFREEFISLSALRADPTQAEGSYDSYLDQDDWYMAARRKAMAPKKK